MLAKKLLNGLRAEPAALLWSQFGLRPSPQPSPKGRGSQTVLVAEIGATLIRVPEVSADSGATLKGPRAYFQTQPVQALFTTKSEVSSMTLRTIGFLVRTPPECRIREHAGGVRTINKTIGLSLLSFALGAVLFATIGSRAHVQDDRAADREA